MQRYDHDYTPEPRGVVIRRRLVTVPRTLVFLAITTAAAPLLAGVGAIVDLIRYITSARPAMTLRLAAFGWVFLAAETVGILWLTATWLVSGMGLNKKLLAESTWRVQRWWARTLLRAVESLFALRFQVIGIDAAIPGPIIAMFRHASIIDNLLPAVLLTDGQGVKLRWVIKRELLTLPSLDIAGRRLPNYFVDRASTDPAAERAAIADLAADLDDDEGVLIFPEGTRFSEDKLQRAVDRIGAGNPDLLARAKRMRHVLPPRLGGSTTLLAADVDVVIVAHEGLGGFASISQIWSGSLVGRTITIEAWRHHAASIPSDRQAQSHWLFDRWLEIDEWVDRKKNQPSTR